MNTIIIKTLASQAALGLCMLAAGAAYAQRVVPTFPRAAAYDIRRQQLIVGTSDGEVRTITSSGINRARDGGRIHPGDGSSILRIRLDARRERLWILDIGNVHVFDLTKNRMIRSIPLPNWFYVDEGSNCLPDLQIDRHGAAFVSDNVQPKIWRIDGDHFSVVERDVKLDTQRNLDVGFSALAIGEGGVMYAAMASPGTLWRIDTGTFSAEKIGLSAPIHGACSLEILNNAGSRDLTLFVLAAGRGRFDIGRIDIVRGASEAHVDVHALGSVPAPASLLAWSGVLHVASKNGTLRVFP